jgi:hypothetical protein
LGKGKKKGRIRDAAREEWRRCNVITAGEGYYSRKVFSQSVLGVTNMLGEWILKGIALVVLGLLNLLGWKHAGNWLDRMVGEVDKEEKPVV